MDKYIVILSIIIVLYFVQKYCIKSEVETFLLTKNILEKFNGTEGGLNILGNIKLANKHVISSESNALTIFDITAATPIYGSIKVNDIDVRGILRIGGIASTGPTTSSFNLPSSFTNSGSTLNITNGTTNSVSINSANGPLILSGQNGIKIGGDIDILGNVTINNGNKPIITRVVTIPANSATTVTTSIDATDYPSITFSGFNNSTVSATATNQIYAAAIEFNTTIGTDNKWYISFTPTLPSEINVRLTFFHKNLVSSA